MKTMVTMIARPDHRLPLRCAQLPGLQVPRQGLHSGNIGRVLSADVLQRFRAVSLTTDSVFAYFMKQALGQRSLAAHIDLCCI